MYYQVLKSGLVRNTMERGFTQNLIAGKDAAEEIEAFF